MDMIYSDQLTKLKEYFISFNEFKTEYENEVQKTEQIRNEFLDKTTSLELNIGKILGDNFSTLDKKLGAIQEQTYIAPDEKQVETNFQLSGYIFFVYIVPLLVFSFLSYKFTEKIFRNII